MNRSITLDSPLLLGFDHTRALMERAARIAGDVYPPFNIEDLGGGRLRIAVAVAGFAPDMLTVTVEDNQLTIVGRKEMDPEGETAREFLHRGIAARGFVRGFILADGLEVEGAVLEDGLLRIDLFRPPPGRQARTVPIRAAG